jgi:hypothetical protein
LSPVQTLPLCRLWGAAVERWLRAVRAGKAGSRRSDGCQPGALRLCRQQSLNLAWRKLWTGGYPPGRGSVKKEEETHMQIVSADISSESLSGMVIFRPHCVSRVGRNLTETTKKGNWYALRPGEVRSFARALLDAADAMDLKSKMLQAAKTAPVQP